MPTLLIVAAILFAYFLVGGFIAARVEAGGVRRCNYNSHDFIDCGHRWASALSAVAWPVAGPLLIGLALGDSNKKPRPTRDEKRQAKELAEAEHKIKLARLNAQATEELERAAIR